MKNLRNVALWVAGVAGDLAIELGAIKFLSWVLGKIVTEKHPWISLLLLILYIGLGLGVIGVVCIFRPFGALTKKFMKNEPDEKEKDEFEE